MSYKALQRITENRKTKAKELGLRDCNLTSLPEELKEFVWLEKLYFGGNKELRDLSPISELTNLKELYCYDTQVSDLSPISGLMNLQEFSCFGTQVSDLSPISQLKNLSYLDCAKTKVSDLSAVSELTNLSYIDCSYTLVSDLSPISKIENLNQLICINTQVKDLFPVLSFIDKGISFSLKGSELNKRNEFIFRECPLINPPTEIVYQGNEAIVKYFEDKEKQGEEKLYEAKIVVVGAGESGKTTLIQKLLNPAHKVPNLEDKRTVGICVTPYPFRGKVKGTAKDLTAYLWDFGGQELYHATHQFFLTPDTLYILLNDNRKNDTDFYYWLNIVRLRAGDGCPILMLFNAKDKSPRQIVPSEELFVAFPGVVQQPLDIDFADNNLWAFERMKEQIESHFTNLEVLGRPYPALWVHAREALGELKDERITYSQFQEVCQSKGVTDEDSMRILAQTLHNLGVLLYFPDVFGLENLVILQPQWCIDAIYRAFDLESILKNHGRFNEKTLADCWSKDLRFKGYSLELLKLMQQFDLCYLVEGYRDEYIAPQLLPLEENRMPSFPGRNAIHVRFEYTFMPAGMLTSLIARLSRHIRTPHVWRTGVTLQWGEGTLAEITEQAFSRQINIKLVGKDKERQRRLSEVRKTLFDIHNRFRGLRFEEFVACNCPDCLGKIGGTMFKLNDLENYKKLGVSMVCVNSNPKTILPNQILEGIAYTDIPRLFISYSHKNEAYKDELRAMIKPLERNGDWKVWDDRYLLPGDDWNGAILRHLSEANVIVLMLTADFFNSDYIYDIEFSRAIQRHESGDALVVGIVVEDCLWEETPLRKIQVVPKDALPVVRHPHRSEVWKAVANKIKEATAAREARSERRGW